MHVGIAERTTQSIPMTKEMKISWISAVEETRSQKDLEHVALVRYLLLTAFHDTFLEGLRSGRRLLFFSFRALLDRTVYRAFATVYLDDD